MPDWRTALRWRATAPLRLCNEAGLARLLLALLLLVLAAALVLFTVRYVRSSDDTIATVYLDGEALYTFALSEVEEVIRRYERHKGCNRSGF